MPNWHFMIASCCCKFEWIAASLSNFLTMPKIVDDVGHPLAGYLLHLMFSDSRKGSCLMGICRHCKLTSCEYLQALSAHTSNFCQPSAASRGILSATETRPPNNKLCVSPSFRDCATGLNIGPLDSSSIPESNFPSAWIAQQ